MRSIVGTKASSVERMEAHVLSARNVTSMFSGYSVSHAAGVKSSHRLEGARGGEEGE